MILFDICSTKLETVFKGGGERYSYTKKDQFIFPGQVSTLNGREAGNKAQYNIRPRESVGGLKSEYGSGTRFPPLHKNILGSRLVSWI